MLLISYYPTRQSFRENLKPRHRAIARSIWKVRGLRFSRNDWKSPLLSIVMNMPLVFSLIFLRPLIPSIIMHSCIRGLALDWVRRYLSNRLQFVQFNGQCSSPQTICCGVPQGSILGPLFFLLYINIERTYRQSLSWFYSLMILIYLCAIKILSAWRPHLTPNLINYPLGLRQANSP